MATPFPFNLQIPALEVIRLLFSFNNDKNRHMLIIAQRLNYIISSKTPSGEVIEIHMIETNKSKAKIEVDAPDDYLILRDELIEDYDFETGVIFDCYRLSSQS